MELFAPGKMAVGCNYWASHAGTAMWSDWRPDVVERDLAALAAAGLTWLRVFPLWPDFQPIAQMRAGFGVPYEIRLGDAPLPVDALGQAGLSAVMMGRFTAFCDIADRHGLKLVVGLITGWMSGRLFAPPALEGLNLITDATAITWQVRFCRGFVTHLRGHTAIAAWDLGNECNNLGRATTPDQAYLWTAALAGAIRSADPDLPMVSGMHTLSASISNQGNPWLIEHQAELTDILTTHPYPYWIRHTRTDPVGSFRTSLHATAESRFYADIGGKPCIAEEIGSMGPMIASDAVSAEFGRVNLFSLWAHDCRAMAWWCAFDQTNLTHAPYDWNGVELELGLIREDGSSKPVLQEMGAFRRLLDSLPFDALPAPKADAVCLLGRNIDDWGVAFGAFLLAKQAKIQLAFATIEQTIPDVPVYILPCISGPNAVPVRKWRELVGRVAEGATLYVSLSDGVVPDFNRLTGVRIDLRGLAARPMMAVLDDGSLLPMTGADDLAITAEGATVLGRRQDSGDPVFWVHPHGKGRIFVYAAPLEMGVTVTPRAFEGPDAAPFWHIYKAFAPGRLSVSVEDPFIGMTEHLMPDGSLVVVATNHTNARRNLTLELKAGFAVEEVWAAPMTDGVIALTPFQSVVLLLRS
jgi:hypothetical protein